MNKQTGFRIGCFLLLLLVAGHWLLTAAYGDASGSNYTLRSNLKTEVPVTGTRALQNDWDLGGADLFNGGSMSFTDANIAALSNLTTNGFIRTSGGIGTLIIDANTYLTTTAAAGDYLKLDQAAPQTVTGGMPSFAGLSLSPEPNGLITYPLLLKTLHDSNSTDVWCSIVGRQLGGGYGIPVVGIMVGCDANGHSGFEALSVTGNGFVGIGEVDPAVELEVGGNGMVTGMLAIGKTTAPNVALDVAGDAVVTGNTTLGDASTDTITCTGRWIPRTVGSDPNANATAGTLGEIVRYGNKWYGKTVASGTDTNWSALN